MTITFEYICDKTGKSVKIDPKFSTDIGYSLNIKESFYRSIGGMISAATHARIEKCLECGETHNFIISENSANL